MISKKNSALIFDPKFFVKNTLTDQNLTLPFHKHITHAGFFFGLVRKIICLIFNS